MQLKTKILLLTITLPIALLTLSGCTNTTETVNEPETEITNEKVLLDFLDGVKINYQDETQKETLIQALEDVMDLSIEELKKPRYKNDLGEPNKWDLSIVFAARFIPNQPNKTLGDNFFEEIQTSEVKTSLKEILDNTKK